MQAIKNNIRQKFLTVIIIALCGPLTGLYASDRSDMAKKWIRQIHDEGAAGLATLLRAKAAVDTGALTLNDEESVKKLLLAIECAAHSIEVHFILDRLTLAAEAFAEKKHQSEAYLEACRQYRKAIIDYRVPFRKYEQEFQTSRAMNGQQYIDDVIHRYQESSAAVYPQVVVMIECCGVEPEQRVYDKALEHRVAVQCIVDEECERLKSILTGKGKNAEQESGQPETVHAFLNRPAVKVYFAEAAPELFSALESGRLTGLEPQIKALQAGQAWGNLQSYAELEILGSQPFSSARWAEMRLVDLTDAQLKQRSFLHQHFDDWGLLNVSR